MLSQHATIDALHRRLTTLITKAKESGAAPNAQVMFRLGRVEGILEAAEQIRDTTFLAETAAALEASADAELRALGG